MVWGSGYTDLPGQDTYGWVAKLEAGVLGVVAFIAGVASSLMCRSLRWLAAIIGVSPLLLLVAASAAGWSEWYAIATLVALAGAYVTSFVARIGRRSQA